MATNTQLARIIAPNINDPNYVDSLANAFEVINSNFKKVASLPFLQGVQGDSYRVIEKPIWTDSWNLTKEGAILLNSIFNDQDYQFYEGEPFAASGRTGVTNSNRTPHALPRLGDYCPADFWKGTDGKPINNSLYFQVVIDDTGAEVDESKVLGQFYYFVDARLKSVGNVFHSDSSNSLSAFNDYSGFYRYVPVKINGELITEPEHYEKADLLPSIYYDATRNDICWKFNGMETGISAIGAKGSDGADATISYVRVDTHQDPPAPSVDIHNTLSAYVNGVFNSKNLSDSNNNNDWAEQRTPLFDSIIKKGFAIICFTDFGEHHETDDTRGDAGSVFAIGYIDQKSSNNEWWAYWSADSYMNRLISFFTINDYFETLGINGPNNGSSAIKFPSIGNAQDTQNLKNKHTIGTAYNSSDSIEGKKRPIIFRNVDCTSSGDQRTTYNQSEHQAVVLDNYQLKLQPYTGFSTDSVGEPDTTKENIVINNKQIDFYANPGSASPSTSITKDSAYFGGTLQATGDVTLNAFNGTKTLIKGETTIKGDTVIGSTDRTNNLTVHGAATIDTKLKVSGDFEAKGNTELWCGYITMKTASGSGNIFRGIKVEKDGTRERHFDISSDVIGITKGPWDSGGAKLYVDGDIETIHGGIIKSIGKLYSYGGLYVEGGADVHGSGVFNDGIEVYSDAKFNGKIKIHNSDLGNPDPTVTWYSDKYLRIHNPYDNDESGIQINAGGSSEYYTGARGGIILKPTGVTIKPKLSVSGPIIPDSFVMGACKLGDDGGAGYGADHQHKILSGGVLSGRSSRYGLIIADSVPNGTIIVVTGNTSGFRDTCTEKHGNGNYLSNGPSRYAKLVDGIYMVLTTGYTGNGGTPGKKYKNLYVLATANDNGTGYVINWDLKNG